MDLIAALPCTCWDSWHLTATYSDFQTLCHRQKYANAVQLIESGLAAGEGFSGGSEYTGLAGIAHAYLRLYESLAAISAGQPGHFPVSLQNIVASQERLLSKAAEMAKIARASPQVGDRTMTSSKIFCLVLKPLKDRMRLWPCLHEV